MKKGFLPPLTFLLLLTIGGVYLFLLTSLPYDSFWSNDDGTKFLVARNLAQRNTYEIHIDYPARDLDPQLKYQPLPPPMGFVQEGKLYGIYSNAFPFFSAFFYKRLSFAGLYLMPLFFGLAALALLTLFFEKEADKMKIILLAAFATPLFFYSLNFWDHTPAVFFALAAFYFAGQGCGVASSNVPAKNKIYAFLAAAGLMTALAEIFRDEAYGFALGLFLAVLWQVKPKKGVLFFLCGQILGILPYWLINLKAFGHPLGPHFSRQPGHYGYNDLWIVFTRSAEVCWTYLFGMQPAWWTGIFLAAALVLVLLTTRLYRRGKLSFPLLLSSYGLYALAAALALLFTIRMPHPIVNSQFVNTIFSGTPFLFFAFLGINREEKEKEKKIGIFTGIVLAAHLAFASLIPMAGGLQWGMRYLLVLYPLLLLLAYRRLQNIEQVPAPHKKYLQGFFILLLLLAVISQGYGYTLLRLKKIEGKKLWQEAADKSQEVLVTDLPWASQEGAVIFYRKKMMYVVNPLDLKELTAELKGRELASFTFLTHRLNTWADTPKVASLGLKALSVHNLRRPGLDYLDLLLVNYEIL